jgi:hypothetical protein
MAPSPVSPLPGPDTPTSADLSHAPAALTTIAWSPCAELTAADWVRHGRWLGALGRGSGWWIGDWLRYGNSRYGDRYGAAAGVTGYDQQSLRNMAYVAGRFEVPRRRGALSFSHHAELAALAVEEQDLWLDRAEAGEWSLRSLRSELRSARRHAALRAGAAESRQRCAETGSTSRPSDPAPNGEIEAPRIAGGRREARRAAPGSNGGSSTAGSHTTVGFVCPKCGCHVITRVDEILRPV